MVKIFSSKDARIPKGATLLAIDDHVIEDVLEFDFYNDITKFRKILVDVKDRKKEVIFKPDEKVRIKLEAPKYRSCENNCDFCFINGLPGGLRKELYFRDDDYRLSFLFGNFLSLTNIDEKDISRIGRLRLSPLYVSVHATDPILRGRIFKNRKAGLILKQLTALIGQGIKLHCQIVVMPEINNGKNLIKTIEDLSRLYPGVNSIGVVPVGKTKHLKDFCSISRKFAQNLIGMVETYHKKFRKKYKRGIIYIADEFYIKAGYSIPATSYYDDFPQYENGVGMVRTFLDELRTLSKISKVKGRNLLLTGEAAFPYLNVLKKELGHLGFENLDVWAVRNRFFGSTVTVSGLLAAQDFSHAIKNLKQPYDRIILPPNCTNDSGKFIDGEKMDDKRVIIAPASVRGLIKCLQS